MQVNQCVRPCPGDDQEHCGSTNNAITVYKKSTSFFSFFCISNFLFQLLGVLINVNQSLFLRCFFFFAVVVVR